jgi:UDP-N-acetylglucosamine 2-epimerase (non-hydrolysing)/GDP/UDP-N,N'-diacetylbacillosamine 2-epimerase (hydrolysing)
LTTIIVITGATGFIGSALCKKLEEKKEYSIIKVTRSQKLKSGFCHVTSYQQTPPGDILIHLGEDPDRSRVNKKGDSYLEITDQVMESLIKKGYKKIVYCSSSIVYGNQGKNLYSENMPTYADDIYTTVKLENEERVLRSGGIVARISNVIGSGMSKNNVLSDILSQIPGKDSLTIRNINPIQDFISVDDAVDAIASLLKNDISGIYNIGSGVGTSINKLIELVLSVSEQDDREIKSTIKNAGFSYSVLNIEKIKKITGWTPKYTLSQSVKKMLNSNEKRVIAVFTGNRAEYGLQFPVLKAIDRHPNLEYKLIVSGAHLDENFGSTLDEIAKDGFHIDAEVKIEMDASTLEANVQAIGTGILSVGEAIKKIQPDMMVVYADRFEGFAAVIAATQMNIPTAHIEGGDLTEGGALDDSVRHAMSKLSHLHFTTNLQASNRLLGMGEEEWRIHTVGFPAIDMISEGNYATPGEIIEKLKIDLNNPIVLFTQHSVTTEFELATDQVKPSLEALEVLASRGVQIIATYPNNDAGGLAIIDKLKALDSRSIENIQVHRSLGRYLYHGILALAQDMQNRVVCMGNSSSGIKETPVFGCPTVNIGSRQKGRLRGQNVIDADYTKESIIDAVTECIADKKFRKKCSETHNPYYIGDAGKKIAKVLAEVKLDRELIRKKMMLKGEVKTGWYR